jgi:hypothetical protein
VKLIYFPGGLLILLSVFDTIIQHKLSPFVGLALVSLCGLIVYAENTMQKPIVHDLEPLKKEIESLKNAVARISLTVGFKLPEK